MKNMSKLKHQVKSNKYYIFWGAATVAVMAGQIYVGNGYRKMSESVKDLTEMIGFKFEMELIEKRRYPNGVVPLDLTNVNPDDYIIWKTTESNVNVN